MYFVKAYFTGQNPVVLCFDEATLVLARERAIQLKAQGFFVEIRDAKGNVVSDDENEPTPRTGNFASSPVQPPEH